MTYDPDGHPDDLDPTNADDVLAFLDDPGNVAIWGAMGHAFATSSAAEQLPDLHRALAAAVIRRDEVAAIVAEGLPDADPRHVLLAATVDEVDALAERIVDLIGPVPDHL